jgi:hypothetical protein
VNNEVVVDLKTFVSQLNELMEDSDAEGFMALCRVVKANAIQLMLEDRPREASEVMADYAEVIDSVGDYEHDFILKVLDLFPVNNFATMNLLGTSDEIDAHIFEHKINIDTLAPNAESGFKTYLEWCAHKKGFEFTTQVMTDITRRAHEVYGYDLDEKGIIANAFLDVMYKQLENVEYPARIDDDIASLIDTRPNDRRHKKDIWGFARRGLRKTLMIMLEHNMLSRYRFTSKDQFEPILACIPETMTLKQTYAVHYHMELPWITEQLLLDDRFNMDELIDLMRNTHYGSTGENDLHLDHIQPFTRFMTPKNFENRKHRNRILQLIEAMVGEGTEHECMNTEELTREFKRNKVPELAYKYQNRVKGKVLEDAMGL